MTSIVILILTISVAHRGCSEPTLWGPEDETRNSTATEVNAIKSRKGGYKFCTSLHGLKDIARNVEKTFLLNCQEDACLHLDSGNIAKCACQLFLKRPAR